MPLAAGELRHRVTIQSPVYVQDETNGEAVIDHWADVATSVPAKVSQLSGRELIAAQATQSNITARVIIRYRPGMSADMRILYRDRIYNPAGFIEDLKTGLEYLTIPVSEGLTDGR